jgi:hypothetical protein
MRVFKEYLNWYQKTIRYEKLLPTQTESLICRLKQHGFEGISFNNTERYTVFFYLLILMIQ